MVSSITQATSGWASEQAQFVTRFIDLRSSLGGEACTADLSFRGDLDNFSNVAHFVGDVLQTAPLTCNQRIPNVGVYVASPEDFIREPEKIRKIGKMLSGFDKPLGFKIAQKASQIPFVRLIPGLAPTFPVSALHSIIGGRHRLYELWVKSPSSLLGFSLYAEFIRGSRLPTDLHFLTFDGGKIFKASGQLTRIAAFRFELDPKTPKIFCNFQPWSTGSNNYDDYKE